MNKEANDFVWGADQQELPRYLFHEGTTTKAYQYLGVHFDPATGEGVFRVWAPHARNVTVIGEFNNWNMYEGGISMQRSPGGI